MFINDTTVKGNISDLISEDDLIMSNIVPGGGSFISVDSVDGDEQHFCYGRLLLTGDLTTEQYHFTAGTLIVIGVFVL